MKVKEIIKRFITDMLGSETSIMLPNHSIETLINGYAWDNFRIKHSPGTYSRAWRDIREPSVIVLPEDKDGVTEWEGFIISEEKTGFKSREKHFRIRRK